MSIWLFSVIWHSTWQHIGTSRIENGACGHHLTFANNSEFDILQHCNFLPPFFTLPLAQLTYVKWLTTFNSHSVKHSIERSQYIWPLVNAHGGHFNYPINQFSLDWTQSWAEFWSFLSDWIAGLRVARVFADTVSQTYKIYCEQIVLVRFMTDNLKDEQSQVFKLPNGNSIVTR